MIINLLKALAIPPPRKSERLLKILKNSLKSDSASGTINGVV